MNCPNCDKLLKPNQKFCPACGTKIELPQEQDNNNQQLTDEQHELMYGSRASPFADEQPELMYGSTASPFADEQPELSVERTGEPVSAPTEPAQEQVSDPSDFDDSFRQEPPSTPPKKKNNIVVIIVIAGAALLLIAGGIFAAMKLNLFGGKDDGKKGKESSSVSDTVGNGSDDKSVPSSSFGPEAVVKRFEKALNDNDESAMQELFTPDGREAKAKTAFTVVSALDSLTKDSLTYKCELENLEYGDGEETASGNIKISADLPVVGTQSTSPKASFKKIDGEWYIDMITLS